jgi:hypothetical protein
MKASNFVRVLCVAALVGLAAAAVRAGEPYPGSRQGVRQARQNETPANPGEADAPADGPEPIAEAPSELGADWENVGGGETCDTCGGDCGGACEARGCLGGLWYGSVDYLLFRPRMSQAVAEVRRVETSDTSVTPNVSTLTDTVKEYPFEYQSGFRVAAGYRLIDCGGDFQVAYWRMTNDAHYNDGPADINNNNPFIAGNLENNPGTGEFLNSSTGVTANIFDVEFGKFISMGGPCNPCECNFCPRWDLRFFAGVRAADISRFNNNVVVNDQGEGQSFGNINARFVGAGPRVGIQGRRYFGQCGLWSLYAKAAQAILIGDYRMGRTLTVPGEDTTPTQITNQFNLFHRTIPVTDIELGGTWQMAPFTYVSVGYFWQCWWDLGQGENIQGTNFGALDSANILGFDGLFVRGEMLF